MLAPLQVVLNLAHNTGPSSARVLYGGSSFVNSTGIDATFLYKVFRFKNYVLRHQAHMSVPKIIKADTKYQRKPLGVWGLFGVMDLALERDFVLPNGLVAPPEFCSCVETNVCLQ